MTSTQDTGADAALIRPQWRGPLAALLLGVTLVAVYVPSLDGQFVWDDHHLIAESQQVTGPSLPWRAFTQPFWEQSERQSEVRGYYRPVVVLSYALDWRLHAGNPAGFRLTNLFVHLLNVLLLWRLLLRGSGRLLTSTLLALGWGLLPRSSEVVAWISGRPDALATTAVLGALLLWPRGAFSRWSAALLLGLGLLCKEVALAGWVALIVLELRSRRIPLAERGCRLLPLLSVGAAYAALRLSTNAEAVSSLAALSPRLRLVSALEALGRYFGAVLVPWATNPQQGFLGYPSLPFVALGVLALAGLTGLLWRSWRRRSPEELMALTLSLVGLGLVLHLVPIAVSVVSADRFAYLPLAGLALFVAFRLREPRWPRVTAASLALLVASFVPFTVAAAVAWKEDFSLLARMQRGAHPRNPTPAWQSAGLLQEAGLYGQACDAYRRAQALLSDGVAFGAPAAVRSDVAADLSGCLVWVGELRGARLEALRAAQLAPSASRSHFVLALAALRELDFDAVQAELTATLAANPQHREARALQGQLASLRGLAATWRAAAPRDVEGLVARARAAAQLGMGRAALDAWREVFQRPGAPANQLDEGLQFMVRFGAPEDVEFALARYGALTGQEPSAEARQAAAVRLSAVERWRALEP